MQSAKQPKKRDRGERESGATTANCCPRRTVRRRIASTRPQKKTSDVGRRGYPRKYNHFQECGASLRRYSRHECREKPVLRDQARIDRTRGVLMASMTFACKIRMRTLSKPELRSLSR